MQWNGTAVPWYIRLVADDAGVVHRTDPDKHGLSFPQLDFARVLLFRLLPLRKEGAEKAGRRRHPQHRVQWVVKNAHGFDRYSQDIPAFPAQWF